MFLHTEIFKQTDYRGGLFSKPLKHSTLGAIKSRFKMSPDLNAYGICKQYILTFWQTISVLQEAFCAISSKFT